jgi:hypothetical protein
MRTRQALRHIQIKENREMNVRKPVVIRGVIRPLELTGAGDLSHLALLSISPEEF